MSTGRSAEDFRTELARRGLLEMVTEICAEHGVLLDAIAGPSRHKTVSHTRQHVWTAIRSVTTLSYPEIGALFGRDHTTIMSGIEAHASRQAKASPTYPFKPQRVGFAGMGAGAGI